MALAPECTHAKVHWFCPDKEWGERELLVGRGHWECDACLSMVQFPMGTGLCRMCQRPIDDDHEDVGTNHQVCLTRRRS